MTNATKATIISAINGLLGLAIAFNIVLTQAQIGAIDVAVNGVLGLFVLLTFKSSSKRIPGS